MKGLAFTNHTYGNSNCGNTNIGERERGGGGVLSKGLALANDTRGISNGGKTRRYHRESQQSFMEGPALTRQ